MVSVTMYLSADGANGEEVAKYSSDSTDTVVCKKVVKIQCSLSVNN